MKKGLSANRGLPLYLVFILIGMGGVLFSTRLEEPARGIVLLLSVAMPLFGVGNLLARIQTGGYQRFLLVAGITMLIVGAMATVANIPGTIIEPLEIPRLAREVSLWVGLLGLGAGLFAILFAVVRREEEMEEVGQRFRSVAEHMGEGFIFSAADGVILQVNKRFLEMTGLEKEKIVGRSTSSIAKELSLDPMLPHIEQRKKGRASEYVIDFLVNGETRHFLVNGTPIFNRRGEHGGTLATLRDVTEQVQMSRSLERYAQGLQRLVEEQTQQLRQSEARLRGLLLHMNEGFMTIDASFRVRFANERMAAMVGADTKELVGRDVFEFVESSARGRLLDLLELARSDQPQRLQHEICLIRQGTSALVPAVVAVAPIRDNAEEGPRFSLVITDVTEQKVMQRQLEIRAAQLEAANEELKVLDRTKDGFLSNVTHELRTPLSTVRGYIEMLESGSLGPMEGPQETALKVMSRNVERLGTLIEEMIEFSRMQIRGVQLSVTLFSVENLVYECVSSIQPQVISRDLGLNAHVPEDMDPVWGDRKRIAQVVSNLLSNAVKFTGQGGTIQIHVSEREDRTLALAVSDTGIGIDPAYQERIFDKFFQVDSSLARRYEGAGIGLSIAKSIAEAHGGRIELESTPGQGSTFTLLLPEAFFDLSRQGRERPSFSGHSFLVCANDTEYRNALARLIEVWGCSVRSVHSGHEAVRLAKSSRPDAVLVDEITADVTGTTMLSLLRQEPETHDVPALLLLERSELSSESPSWSRHVLRLAKPFTPQELMKELHHACFEEQPEGIHAPAQEAQAAGPPRFAALVADTDPDFLDWLETSLRRRGLQVCCVASHTEALEALGRIQTDVVFLDVDSPETDTGASARGIVEAAAELDTPVYLMTGLPGDRGELGGAAGTLFKPFGIQEMIEVIATCRNRLETAPNTMGAGNNGGSSSP